MKRLIRTRTYPSGQPDARPLLLMCGLWGSVWQTRRLIYVLNKAGYDVMALDFSAKVITSGDPQPMIQLVDEVVAYADELQRAASQPVELVGISMGALLALNIARRLPAYQRAVLITGGDIAKIAQWLRPRTWSRSYDELAHIWGKLNMYTDPTRLRGKRLLFVLHTRGRMIDPRDATQELQKQRAFGNDVQLVERHRFGHIGTIVDETIIHPRRVLEYLKRVS